jgi:hypothetical protein
MTCLRNDVDEGKAVALPDRRFRWKATCLVLAVWSFAVPCAAQELASESQDGTASVIPLSFSPRSVTFDSTGTKALALFVQNNQSQLATCDTDTLKLIGQFQHTGVIAAVVPYEANYLLIDLQQQRIMVVDPSLTLLAQRQFKAVPGNVPTIFDGAVQVASRRYSLPNLEPIDRGRPVGSAQMTDAGWILEGFIMDAARRKPLWFAGNSAIPGKQAQFRYGGRAKDATGRPRAPMVVRGTLAPDLQHPWELQLATPLSVSFESYQKATDELPSPDWVRLQAVPPSNRGRPEDTDVVLGRIRVALPDGVNLRKEPGVAMAATRLRCVAAVGKNLIVFRFKPERAAEWGDVPRISLDQAPVLVPADRVTSWDVKPIGNRTIEQVEVRQGPLTWDTDSRRLLIDPRPVVAAADRTELLAQFTRGRRIAPTASFEQALVSLHNRDYPIVTMLEVSGQRPLKGLLMSVPVDFVATCTDGAVLELAGNVVTEVDPQPLRAEFQLLQSRRLAAMKPPPLDPNRQLAIIYPKPSVVAGPDTAVSEPVPLIPNGQQLGMELLLSVVFMTLVTALFLRLSWSLANLFDRETAVPLPSLFVSFALALLVCLLVASIDSLLLAAMGSRIGPHDNRRSAIMALLIMLDVVYRGVLMTAAVKFLGRVSFVRALGIAALWTVTTAIALAVTSVLVVLGLYVLQQMGIL